MKCGVFFCGVCMGLQLCVYECVVCLCVWCVCVVYVCMCVVGRA